MEATTADDVEDLVLDVFWLLPEVLVAIWARDRLLHLRPFGKQDVGDELALEMLHPNAAPKLHITEERDGLHSAPDIVDVWLPFE